MAEIKLKGNPINTSGELLPVGSNAPDFTLVNQSLENLSLGDFDGKRLVLNIFPSIDTPVCAASVRRFNQIAAEIPDTVVLCISKDLPFALQRFCGAEGIKNVVTLSSFRDLDFGKNYGMELIDGPLQGLYARAIIVLDKSNKVIYNELVPEIGQEPDYSKALAALK